MYQVCTATFSPRKKPRGEKVLDGKELQEEGEAHQRVDADWDKKLESSLSQVSSELVATMMIRRQISFDADLYAKARASAKRHGISFAELCRRAVAEVIARESADRPWMAFAGVLDGHKSDSESVDSVLYDREAT